MSNGTLSPDQLFDGTRVHRSVYIDPALFALERRRLFAREQAAGFQWRERKYRAGAGGHHERSAEKHRAGAVAGGGGMMAAFLPEGWA